MNTRFALTKGDRPTIVDTLADATGTVINLTGCTVKILFQGPGVNFAKAATIDVAASGKVKYQFAAGETDVPGNYYGQWQVTDAGAVVVQTVPGDPFLFTINPGLPVANATSDLVNLSDFFEDIRALVGDFKKRKIYQDSDIASVMRSQLRLGRVRDDDQQVVWKVSPDGLRVSPAITSDDALAYGLLVYHSAHTLVLPNMGAYQYRTRALSERFGEQKDFLFQLQNAIYDLENGTQTWANVSGLRNWLFAVNGIWVWSYLQTEQTIDLSFK